MSKGDRIWVCFLLLLLAGITFVFIGVGDYALQKMGVPESQSIYYSTLIFVPTGITILLYGIWSGNKKRRQHEGHNH